MSSKGVDNVVGHRSRVKEKFMRGSIRTLADYEILEMLLFKVFSRRDTKPISKELLNRFGSLEAVIAADSSELLAVDGVGESVVSYFKLLLDLFSRLLLPLDHNKVHILNNWSAVISYCQLTMGFKKREHFRLLLLNKKNILIGDEIFDAGTVDRVAIYPREIVRLSILYSASSVILVHNHPSNDIAPSPADIDITRQIAMALKAVNVGLHDHLVVGQNQHFSFKNHNIL